jgi:hypothetical protein
MNHAPATSARLAGLVAQEEPTMRRILLIAMLTAITLAAAPANAPKVAAEDESPCGYTFPHEGSTAQYCPLWRGNVPVYDTDGSNRHVVGYLVHGGWANWFLCHRVGSTYVYEGHMNNWWALTMADNGKWGFVSEVFFAGGEDFDPDRGLVRC